MRRAPAFLFTITLILAVGGELLAAGGARLAGAQPFPARAPASAPRAGSAPAGATPTPVPRPCPASPNPTLVEHAHYRAPSYDLKPFGGAAGSCRVTMYADTDAPPLPDFPEPDIVLSASGPSLQFRYHVHEPVPGVNDRLLNGLDLFSDDNIEFSFIDGHGDARFVAVVNPSGNCTAIASSVLLRFAAQPCSVAQAVTHEGNGPWDWQGVLSVPVSALPAPDGVIRFFAAMTFQHRKHSPRPGANEQWQTYRSFCMIGTVMRPCDIVLTLQSEFAAASDRYGAAASDLGYIVGTPPHRANVLAFFPTEQDTAVGAAFSDNAKPLSAVRDAVVKQVFTSDQTKQLSCVSCGSFKNVAPTVYDRTITSATVLGNDFSNIGVDSVPFSLNAMTYPIDGEYGASTFDEQLAAAAFHGTTSSSGWANDIVGRAAHTFTLGSGILQLSAFQVESSRSGAKPGMVGSYHAVPLISPHTSNSEISAALRTSNQPRDLDDAAVNQRGVIEVDVLTRFGTQHGGSDSHRVDVAATITRDHAIADKGQPIHTADDFSLTVGYRNVGDFYRPNLGSADPVVGLHGYYWELTNNLFQPGVKKPVAVSITGYTFRDAIEVRNQSVTAAVAIPLASVPCAPLSAAVPANDGGAKGAPGVGRAASETERTCAAAHFALVASGTAKTIAQSQAAAAFNKAFVLPDALGGLAHLPNGSYSGLLTYTNVRGAFNMSVGYTGGPTVTCDVNATRAPCYSYRETGVTINAYGTYRGWLVGALTEKKTDDNSLDLIELAGARNLVPATQPIVENRIVRSLGLAAILPKPFDCSSATMTLSNQSAPLESFIASAPQPGFTTTYGVDIVAAHLPVTLFAGFSRTSAPSSTKQFVVRARLGAPLAAYANAITSQCNHRSS